MLFEAEYKQMLELKKGVIEQAMANGVANSSTLQMIVSRLDAKIEDVILHLAHAGQNFEAFKKMAEDAVAAGATTAGAQVEPPAPTSGGFTPRSPGEA